VKGDTVDVHAKNLERGQEVLEGIKRDRDRNRADDEDSRKKSRMLTEKADTFTRAVIEGDEKAAGKKLALLEDQRKIDLRVSDLGNELVSLDRRIEEEQRAVAQLQLYAAAESLAENIKTQIPILSARLSAIIAPVAELCAELNKMFESAISESLPLLANGDPARIRSLENRLRMAVVNGTRAELASRFQGRGLHLLDTPGHLPTSFQGIVGPAVDALLDAIRSSLPANDADGTSRFRCRTQISGLYGLFLREGEIVSLRADDPDVRKLVEMGSLGLIGEASLVKGAA
jgi:hypothetical protein